MSLIVLQGIAGSGKTHFAQALKGKIDQKNGNGSTLVVTLNNQQEKSRSEFTYDVKVGLLQGKVVIVDYYNLYFRDLLYWAKVGEECNGAKTRVVTFKLPAETCTARQDAGTRKGGRLQNAKTTTSIVKVDVVTSDGEATALVEEIATSLPPVKIVEPKQLPEKPMPLTAEQKKEKEEKRKALQVEKSEAKKAAGARAATAGRGGNNNKQKEAESVDPNQPVQFTSSILLKELPLNKMKEPELKTLFNGLVGEANIQSFSLSEERKNLLVKFTNEEAFNKVISPLKVKSAESNLLLRFPLKEEGVEVDLLLQVRKAKTTAATTTASSSTSRRSRNRRKSGAKSATSGDNNKSPSSSNAGGRVRYYNKDGATQNPQAGGGGQKREAPSVGLLVKGIPSDVSAKDLFEALKKLDGGNELLEVHLRTPVNWAFVNFATVESARKALAKLPGGTLTINNATMEISERVSKEKGENKNPALVVKFKNRQDEAALTPLVNKFLKDKYGASGEANSVTFKESKRGGGLLFIALKGGVDVVKKVVSENSSKEVEVGNNFMVQFEIQKN